MLIYYIPTSKYFSQFTSWDTDKTILDFGSNWGNLLASNPTINQEQYTGIDVDQEAINAGLKLFPRASWIRYDRFNPVYNSTGTTQLPTFTKKFDMIFSYSVFSHTTAEDMVELIEVLYNNLNTNGRMYFTYCDIYNRKLVEWFRNRRTNCDEIPTDKDYVYLADNKISNGYPSERCIHFVSFYKEEWILSLLKKYNPILYKNQNKNFLQDCICLCKN